jgi:hypothetical protein
VVPSLMLVVGVISQPDAGRGQFALDIVQVARD